MWPTGLAARDACRDCRNSDSTSICRCDKRPSLRSRRSRPHPRVRAFGRSRPCGSSLARRHAPWECPNGLWSIRGSAATDVLAYGKRCYSYMKFTLARQRLAQRCGDQQDRAWNLDLSDQNGVTLFPIQLCECRGDAAQVELVAPR